MNRRRISLAVLMLALVLPGAARAAWVAQPAGVLPALNPLKGLVPYAGAANPDNFPHSMEFSYFPLSAVLVGPDRYDWTMLDRFLEQVAGRGHQAVFRFHTEYPGKRNSLPQWLVEAGVGLIHWERMPSQPGRAPVINETPDYRHPALREALIRFIAALGARYDNDPRIAGIAAGLLGLWGEWHDWPRNDLFADIALQQAVMDAYAQAFRRTPVLLRYPAGANDPEHPANSTSRFGYHDDSFAWNTLPVKASYFVSKLQAANALDAWQTRPIGGEIRPEAWGKVFDAEPGLPALQDFTQCAEATHVSWLMDSGMFKTANPSERRERALDATRHMGYAFRIRAASLERDATQLQIRLQIDNAGVAPFYADWPLRYALLGPDGQILRETYGDGLAGILPGATGERSVQLPLTALPPGTWKVLVQGANPLPGGLPVRFGNARQDQALDGWLGIGQLEVR